MIHLINWINSYFNYLYPCSSSIDLNRLPVSSELYKITLYCTLLHMQLFSVSLQGIFSHHNAVCVYNWLYSFLLYYIVILLYPIWCINCFSSSVFIIRTYVLRLLHINFLFPPMCIHQSLWPLPFTPLCKTAPSSYPLCLTKERGYHYTRITHAQKCIVFLWHHCPVPRCLCFPSPEICFDGNEHTNPGRCLVYW